jgi:hypothetical protein
MTYDLNNQPKEQNESIAIEVDQPVEPVIDEDYMMNE